MKNVLIIANPKAGKASAKKFLPKIEQFLKTNQFNFTTYFTQNTSDYQGITSAINSVEEIFAVLIVGGDGTLNDVVNSIPENFKPPILILPCGSGNDFAKYIHGNKRLEEILACLKNNSSKASDCGVCNNKRFINGLGIGFDGWVAGKANEGPAWLPAQLKYHLAILRGLFKFKFFESNLGKSLIIAVANGPTYGGGFKIAPNANPFDGKLDLWQIEPINLIKRPYYLTLIKNGNHQNQSGPYSHKSVSEIKIQSSQVIPAHLDGEYFESNIFEINILKGFVKFLT